MIIEFSKAVCEKIGYYVYVLVNPKNNTIFYVGKGQNNRVFEHAHQALQSDDKKSEKLELIREIGADKVKYFILRHGLDEKLALEIESACIDLLGLDNLTNIIKGHHFWEHGIKSVEEIVQYYGAEIVVITEPMIIININKQYFRGIEADKLYEITRSSWKVGIKRESAKYAVASFRGLVREIYEIQSWEDCGNGRWEFIGKVAEAEIQNKYKDKSLDNYKSSQNPIKYTF